MTEIKEPQSVDEALNRYWRDKSLSGNCPDYSGFQEWITHHLHTVKSAVPLPLHSGTLPYPNLLLELSNAVKAAGIEITRETATPDAKQFAKWDGKQSKLKRLNKSKLLLHYLIHSPPRWREFLLAVSKQNLSAGSASRTSSQSEYRLAFFQAVGRRDALTASKLVGRLREESHDEGERAFLEATASFHSNRFDEAVRYAREVSSDAIDWPRAFMLLLESHSYLGDIDSIEAEISSHSGFIFPDYFLRYVCQVAVANSRDPERTLERAKDILGNALYVSPDGQGAFQLWNRYSCQLAVRLLEQLIDACLTKEALVQTAAEGEPIDELESSVSFRQLGAAIALDPDLLCKLAQTSSDDAYQEIVKRLMNFGTPGRDDYFQALTTQWRIGDQSVFLDNVLSTVDRLLEDQSPEAMQALAWAYQEAMLLDRHSDVQLLRHKLLVIPTMASKLTEIDSTNTTNRLERMLSPMATVALRSANWDLAQATKDALLWKDAGMISLGFFRILELEFHARLIRPMLQNVDREIFESNLAALKSDVSSRTERDAVAFWDRMLPLLWRTKQDNNGLELGPLEMILAKVASPAGVDAALKMPIHVELLKLLSPTGAEAFKSRSLSHLVDSAVRERFRNPPAHSRYVGLSTARECKQYVENALTRLIEFTERDNRDSSSVH